jgi:hypothetical protein
VADLLLLLQVQGVNFGMWGAVKVLCSKSPRKPMQVKSAKDEGGPEGIAPPKVNQMVLSHQVI